MTLAPSPQNASAAEKNRLYYNEIAGSYDEVLDRESTNEMIREKVKHKFTGIVKQGRVLDFGGGTGRDLDWLITHPYEVVFCEPSEKMREKAIYRHKNNPGVTFLENKKADFTYWHAQPPFAGKVDAILSDFAVINCIADIDLVFKNLAQLIKPGGVMIALMLKYGYKKNWKWKLREGLQALLSRKPLVINIQHHDFRQIVYVYKLSEIKKASAAYFEMQGHENMYEFTLFHLIRK